MRIRVMCLIAVALGSVIAAPGAALATPTTTTLTIRYLSSGGFAGTVKSTRSACVRNRLVKVFKVGRSSYLYQDTSDNQGNWNTGNSGRVNNGDYYAKTAAKSSTNCGAARSPTLRIA
jgi:hypothetical protein